MCTTKMLLSSAIIVVMAVGQSTAQTRQPTDAEKAMAAQIKCEDWKKNPNDTWTSGPSVKIGGMTFANNTFGIRGLNIGGADIVIVLNQKCGGSPL
jgi:hypothetical protein